MLLIHANMAVLKRVQQLLSAGLDPQLAQKNLGLFP